MKFKVISERCHGCGGKPEEMYELYIGEDYTYLCKGCAQEVSQKISTTILRDSLSILSDNLR